MRRAHRCQAEPVGCLPDAGAGQLRSSHTRARPRRRREKLGARSGAHKPCGTGGHCPARTDPSHRTHHACTGQHAHHHAGQRRLAGPLGPMGPMRRPRGTFEPDAAQTWFAAEPLIYIGSSIPHGNLHVDAAQGGPLVDEHWPWRNRGKRCVTASTRPEGGLPRRRSSGKRFCRSPERL